MFSASAEIYDLIYSGIKDYRAEAAQIAALIRRVHPQARRVLDVACGTAEHARLLTDEHGFNVDGLDLDSTFVRIAKQKLPSASIFEADMSTFVLPQRYDAILCLFSSIGYVKTLERVRQTLMQFRAHLDPEGIVLVEPWFAPDAIHPGRSIAKIIEAEGITICRMSHIRVEGRISRLRFEYLIGRDTGIDHASEDHELGLFTSGEMQACFAAAGFSAEFDSAGLCGRGLYVARVR
jgi:ubiquinone/menaquinone biosynthesis C-methylase UbiE